MARLFARFPPYGKQEKIKTGARRADMVNFFYRLFTAFCLSLLALTAANAQPTSPLKLEVSPRTGRLNDSFVLSVIVEGNRGTATPFLNGGNDFKVSLIGPRQEVHITNGTVLSKTSYNYLLIAKKAGLLETPSAEIEIDGEVFKADGIQIKVSEPDENEAAQNENYFLRQMVDKKVVYQGEQVGNTIELYSRVRLLDPQISDLSLDDFLSLPGGKEERASRVIEGSRYDITRIRKALYPLRSGRVTLPPRKITANVPVTKQQRPPGFFDPFADDFFSGFFSTREYERREFESNSIELLVKPPPPPPTDDFKLSMPIVGDTEISVSGMRSAMKTGESRTLTVRIESTGNVNPITEIPFDFGSKARVYPETPETSVDESFDPQINVKVFKLSVVPLSSGNLTIPSLRLAYFDSESGKYKFAMSQEFVIPVSGSELWSARPTEPAAASSQSSTSSASSALKEAAPAEQPEVDYLARAKEVMNGPYPILVVALAAFYWFALYVRSKSSELLAATARLQTMQQAKDFSELESAFEAAVAKKLNLAISQAPDAFKNALEARLSEPALKFSVMAFLDELEVLRYGRPNNPPSLDSMKERAVSLFQQV